MCEPAAILVDWGTTNFRAWLTCSDGKVMDRCEARGGIMQVPAGGFAQALDAHVGKWRAAYPGLDVLMSGMVGSKQGWAEAPYVPCPAGIADLARAVMPVPDEKRGQHRSGHFIRSAGRTPRRDARRGGADFRLAGRG